MADISMDRTLAEALGTLVGRKLSSVTFLADYVQLAFDGPGMSAYTMPTVACGTETRSFGQPGYRNSLCMQIGSQVKRTEVGEECVSIIFETGEVISISLRDEDCRGPEALEFHLDAKDRFWVL
jgi:hypothetical protein